MSERCFDAMECRPEDLRCAMSIHTRKITDSCRDKDCIEDLRVYLTKESQSVLDAAQSAKIRSAELIYTAIDVSPVAFHRSHYTVDLTFYYKIIADAAVSPCRPAAICGLAMFGKRAVLCGENSGAHIFRSDAPGNSGGTLPTAVVEVLDPMVLSAKLTENCDCSCGEIVPQIPAEVLALFDEQLVTTAEQRRLVVTLGQFSIIRLERNAQFVIPVLDGCIPTKECADTPSCAEDPCEMFSRIPFPTQQFCPTGCPPLEASCGSEA